MRKLVFLLCGLSLFSSLAYATPKVLPTKIARDNSSFSLSLDDAILFAVRENPNVVTSRLSYVLNRFELWVQEWQFLPHYSLQASANVHRGRTNKKPFSGTHNYTVTPSISLLTPIGTNLTLTSTNVKTNNFNPTLSLAISQPLLRGFGTAVVEAALFNARDSEVVSRLNIEGKLRSTVTGVINTYLDVMNAERTIMIDEQALTRAVTSVKQTKLFIKAGRKAGNELVTVEATVASAKANLENDKNSLLKARYALLTAIGMDPNTPVTFATLNLDRLLKKYHLPTMDTAKRLILANDIQYQTDQITLYGQKSRSLMVAEDNTRWQLNFTATASTGSGNGGGYNAGFNNIFNGANIGQNVGFTLQIPIDDQLAKQSVLSAKIALKEASIGLVQERWQKETSAINGWNSVVSAERSLRFAEDAERLQTKTYKISFQKYLHGLIDSLELQSAQVSLIDSQQSLLRARIAYIKALVDLDELIGNTLKTWDIKVRY